MIVRFANETEVKNWDTHVLANSDGGNILQGKFFVQLKETSGWTPRFVWADDIAITVLEKPIFGLGKVWYVPKGPGVSDEKQLGKLTAPLRDFAREQGCFTIKIEPELAKGTKLTDLGLIKTRPIQYNYATVIIDLTPDLATILTTMHQKGRYAIKRAERDGVTTKAVDATDENCEIMYDLFRETAETAGFGIRSAAYYRSFWQGYEKSGIGQMFFAYYEGDVVAAAFVVAYGTKGTYKDGASIRQRTAYGASHALQWEAIKWLKKRHITSYDLCGAPPADQASDPEHPFHGVGLFKRSFNPEITEYVGAYEIPVNPLKSKIWTKFLEKVIRRVYYKMNGESYY